MADKQECHDEVGREVHNFTVSCARDRACYGCALMRSVVSFAMTANVAGMINRCSGGCPTQTIKEHSDPVDPPHVIVVGGLMYARMNPLMA